MGVRSRLRTSTTAVLAVLAVVASTVPASAAAEHQGAATHVRFATYNASLNRAHEGELLADLSEPGDEQATEVAEVIQRNRPDVLLINEFDYVPGHNAVDAFRKNYLGASQQGARPIEYPYAFTAPVNTGVPTGLDLDNDGHVGGPGDAQGFGFFEGQYGMLVLSKHPIDRAEVRTFQRFRWKDMPGAMLPDDPSTPEPADWYSREELDVLRLSSKSHWDVPIRIGDKTVHFLVSHPTPPTFDGPEDRNGKRNHDELRFWADYVTPGQGGYIYDDSGRVGGLGAGELFVIAGDQNSDPADGDSVPGAAEQLLTAPRVRDPRPGSSGGVLASLRQGGANRTHEGNPRLDTADFGDDAPGNLRVDYVLPSSELVPLRREVFWPTPKSDLARLNDASDHHMVWVDLLLQDAGR